MSWESAHITESPGKKIHWAHCCGADTGQHCIHHLLSALSKRLSTELSLPPLPPQWQPDTYNASKHHKAGALRPTWSNRASTWATALSLPYTHSMCCLEPVCRVPPVDVPQDRHHSQLHTGLQNCPCRCTTQSCFPCPKGGTGTQFFTAVSTL